PPDVKICFNFEPDAGVVTKKVVGDISEHDVLMPNLLPIQPTLCPVFDLLLPFSSENEDKLFKLGIFSSPFLSHWAKITFDFSENPMMISERDIPHLDVPYLHFYPPLPSSSVGDRVRLKTRLTKISASREATRDCLDFEDSRARGFVHRSLDLQSFACLYMGIRYPRSY
ncbi:hypothetical protein Tco_0130853, partial [Tanacetum coccineum]